MWENIFEMAANSGIWAFLFVSLFFIQLKDSKTRETKYQTVINELAESLKVVKEIHDDIENLTKEIKNTSTDIKSNLKE